MKDLMVQRAQESEDQRQHQQPQGIASDYMKDIKLNDIMEKAMGGNDD